MNYGLIAIKDAAGRIKKSAGVYRMLDADGAILYIGKARDVKKRVLQYTQLNRLPTRLQRMVAKTRDLEFTFTRTEAEALLLEANLIKQHQPPFNLMLKDDKSYPYIKIDLSHEFPRIHKYRGRIEHASGEFFGPYASAGAVNQAISLLQKLFLLRPCKDSYFANRSKPCLQYQIKRCSAPCVGKITAESYATMLAEARSFLKGQAFEVRDKIAAEMEAASARLDFEQAAILRDRLKALTTVQQEQRIYISGLPQVDFVAIAGDGERACAQVFSFRNGQNLGSRSYFLNIAERDMTEVLSQFISQFYVEHECPAEIYLSADNGEIELLAAALTLKEGRNIKIAVPQRGDKKDVMDFAVRNAKSALEMRQSEQGRYAKQYAGLAELFGLEAPPKRIEIYDNSHTAGQYPLGVMVVAGGDGFIKSAYRIFNSRDMQLAAGDDYGLMREVMRRRFRQGNDSHDIPDLMIIDGGAGQLSAVNAVLDELGVTGISVVAMAKGIDRNAGNEEFHIYPSQFKNWDGYMKIEAESPIFRAEGSETKNWQANSSSNKGIDGRGSFRCKQGDPVLYLLQRMRDEAHRFAIGSHRKRRAKAMTGSKLDEISGIGAKRRKMLLHRFGSVKGISEATVEELASVDGIGKKTAQIILDDLNGCR